MNEMGDEKRKRLRDIQRRYYYRHREEKLAKLKQYRSTERGKAKTKEWKLQNADKIKQQGKEYAKKHRSERLKYEREYRKKNRERMRAVERSRISKDPERQRNRQREWRKDNEGKLKQRYLDNRDEIIARVKKRSISKQGREMRRAYANRKREHIRERFREWYNKNRDILKKKAAIKLAEKRKDPKFVNKLRRQARASAKRFYAAHPELVRFQYNRRKALAAKYEDKNGALAAFYRYVKNEEHVFCYYCEEEIPKGRHRHVDHIIPIARDGPHVIENVCSCCHWCNSSKGKKLLSEWKRPGQMFLCI